jgi:hypothetical protein
MSEVYGYKALWNLLAARVLALKVNPNSAVWDEPIRSMILRVCGGDQASPHKRDVIGHSSIDDLYPRDRIEDGFMAECGTIVWPDGMRFRGKGVDWQ